MSFIATEFPTDEGLPFIACEPVERTFFETAPQRYVNQVTLPCSADALFAVFEDPASWPRWATGIGEVEWTSPKPYQPGTTRTVRFWGGMCVYEDFFLYDPPREMAFHFYGTSELVWSRFAEHYRVEALGDDRCRLTWTVAYEPAGVFGRLHLLIRPIMQLNFRIYMWRLRRYVARLRGTDPSAG